MKINEVEQLLNITKPNIRFYEKKGLLSPARNENGYREYSGEDIETLKKIILFRKMGISIEDIKALLDGEKKLSEVVNQNVAHIEEQMKELQGALCISRRMQKDRTLDETFSLDTYWNAMVEEERQGLQFFDIMKDYLKFESGLFFEMWETVFWTDLKELLTGKKYVRVVLIVAVICMIRGLAYHYLWKAGSILAGAVYPFVIFVIASILVLLLYVLNKIFSDAENTRENETVPTDAKSGFAVTLLTIIFAVAGILFWVIFVPFLLQYFYFDRINAGVQYVSTSPMAIPYVIAALFLCITLFWLILKKGLFANRVNGEKGLVCHLPKKLRIRVALAAFGIYFLISFLYATCYNQIDDTGFKKRRIFVTTHYRFEDVEYYQLYAQSDGTLGLFFRLQDGSKMEYYASVVSSNVDDSEDYAVALAQKLTALGVKCKIDDEEKLYKRLSYDYWKETVEKLIAVSDVEN
jgi:DNA-binding transcriptional MerR regulator